MGLLTQSDSTLYRDFFKEMTKLRGHQVLYRYVIEKEETIHSEFKVKLSDPIAIDIIYDENPRVNTLQKLGWVSENPDDKPYVAYLPFDTPHLSYKAVISIPQFTEINLRYRDFEVTDIKSLIEFPDSWICRLAPIFDTTVVNNNYDESNYNYIHNYDETPEDDTPNNVNYGYIKI